MSELLPFKNIHDGETVLLLGTGSTLNKFKDNFGSNVKRCAVNGVIIHPEYRENLDYFIWAGDIDIPEHPQPGYNNILQASSLLGTHTKKFVNCWTDGSILHPDSNIQTQVHPDDAKKLVAIGNKIRNLTELGLTETVSTRLLVDAGKLIHSGLPKRLAVKVAIVEPLTDELQIINALTDLSNLMI